GAKEALKAQEHFVKTVQKKEIPEEIQMIKIQETRYKLIDLLLEVKLSTSKSEARRLIEQGGVKVNNEVVQDANREIEITKEGVLLQRGKRQFVKVVR
ncbi:MAG: S4 domain-containing protein, partial [Patescibacteria group bacterium]